MLHPGYRILVLALALCACGCRSMSNEPRPVPGSRTYQAATRIDPEPHVLSITIHAPTLKLNYASPRQLTWSLLPGTLGEILNAKFRERTGRTFAWHLVGHATVELKSTDPATGQLRYLLTAVTDLDRRETNESMFKKKVGFALATRGTAGRLESAEEVARDLNESAELGIHAARVRFLISPEAAAKMFDFFEDFQQRRIYEQFKLSSDPLSGNGAGCTSLSAGFLRAAGLMDQEMKEAWQLHLRVPERLMGEPENGKKVPPRMLLFGPDSKRWAGECEPHFLMSFYDTTRIYDWILRHHALPKEQLPAGFSKQTPVECAIERLLAMPVVTVDLRTSPNRAPAR